MSERAFKKEVERAIDFYENFAGYPARRVHQMMNRYPSEIEAISHLVTSADLQQGFKVLRDGGHLDKTFEALVVQFQSLFRTEVVQAAQWRLDNPYALL
ncbi:MAG: hypothetical protein WAN11_12495 [Syntrophobacteraceae bacterium]